MSTVWGLLTIIAVLVVLSVTTIASISIHHRKTRESERRFRLLFARAFDAILLLDKSKGIVDANAAARRLFAHLGDGLANIPIGELLDPAERLHTEIELDKVLRSGRDYVEKIEIRDKEGSKRHLETAYVRLQIDGDVFLAACFRDFTRVLNVEEELKIKNATLAELISHIEQERVKYRSEVGETVDKVLVPALEQLKCELGPTKSEYLEALRQGLFELASPDTHLMDYYSRLSPREVEICNLIRHGATSKQISNALGISLFTVEKHRQRIRRKLVISRKDFNLKSLLKNSPVENTQ